MAQGKKSGVITVTAKAESPELAQRILQLTIDSFRVQHLRMNHTVGSYEFFVEQVAEGKRQLSRASEELRQAKDRLGISSIEGQRNRCRINWVLWPPCDLKRAACSRRVKRPGRNCAKA